MRTTARKMCTFHGCRAREHSREGYCSAHKKQFAAGEPLTELVNGRGNLPWLMERVNAAHDTCVEWPFSRNKAGYGSVHFRGKSANTHRVMCILAHGDPPFDGAEAAHSCGNTKCVNPNHLSWKTAVANNMDKVVHGTMPMGSTHWNNRGLTEGKVAAIREFSHTVKPKTLADLFNVSVWTIYPILRGQTWKHV